MSGCGWLLAAGGAPSKVVGWYVRGQAWVAESVVLRGWIVLCSVYRLGVLPAGVAVAAAASCTDCLCCEPLCACVLCASLGCLVC